MAVGDFLRRTTPEIKGPTFTRPLLFGLTNGIGPGTDDQKHILPPALRRPLR